METRKQAKDICPELGLQKPLERFTRAGRVPSAKDVLRHLFYQMKDTKKKDVSDAANATAENLIEVWLPNYIPLMRMNYIVRKIKKLYESYLDVKKRSRKSATNDKKREDFMSSLEQRFDISADKAEDLIRSDHTLSLDEKEEDLNFLRNIRENLPHSLGCFDGKRKKRLERAEDRADEQNRRLEIENERKQVFTINTTSVY